MGPLYGLSEPEATDHEHRPGRAEQEFPIPAHLDFRKRRARKDG